MKGQFYILAAVVVLLGIYVTVRYLNEELMLQPSTPSDELGFSQDVKSAFEALLAEPESEFVQDFRTVQKLINERSAGAFSVSFNCSGECPGEEVQVRTVGLSGELNFLFNITRDYQPEPWWDDNVTDGQTYDYRIKLILSENAGVPRPDWPFVLTGSDLESQGVSLASIDINSTRLVDPDASADEADEVNGNDIPFQIDHKDGTGDFVAGHDDDLDSDDELVFVLDLSALQTKDVYVYFSRDGVWPPKSYSSDLSYSGYQVNTSRYSMNYSDGWAVVDRLAVDWDGDAVINETSLISSMSPKVLGSFTAYNGTGVLASGPVRVVVDSAVYEVNSSSFYGNVSRRFEHWMSAPVFKLSHRVVDSNDAGSDRLQFEDVTLASNEWYRAFYPLADGTPSGGWNTTVVSEQIVPGYLFAYSADSGTAGFVFTDSPSLHNASSVVQWAFERGASDELSRKAWLKASGSNSSQWESWVFVSPDNSTQQPVDIWEGFSAPVFQRFWKEETG